MHLLNGYGKFQDVKIMMQQQPLVGYGQHVGKRFILANKSCGLKQACVYIYNTHIILAKINTWIYHRVLSIICVWVEPLT